MGNSFPNDNSVLAELGLLRAILEMVDAHLEEEERLLQSLLLKQRKDHNEERHRQSRKKETPQPTIPDYIVCNASYDTVADHCKQST